MTVRWLKDYLNSLPEADLDCQVITPMRSALLGIFAFEDVCPGVTEMIELGEVPEFVGESTDQVPNQRCLLIAGHSFHEERDNDDNEGKNNIEPLMN